MIIDYPNIDPVFFQIGFISVRWYGLAYLAGLVIAWRGIRHVAVKRGVVKSAELIDDLIFWIAIGVIIGGRLGHVFLYEPSMMTHDFLGVFKIWQGGMSFHGGMLGVIAALYLWSKYHHVTFLRLTDVGSLFAPFGLLFGRIANFINGELWGRPTDGSWGMIFPHVDNVPRHPSQLYEALFEGFVLLLIVWAVRIYIDHQGHQKKNAGTKDQGENTGFWARLLNHKGSNHFIGLVSSMFLVCYGLFRFVLEIFRVPDGIVSFGIMDVTLGQIYSLPMIIAGLVIMYFAYTKKWDRV